MNEVGLRRATWSLAYRRKAKRETKIRDKGWRLIFLRVRLGWGKKVQGCHGLCSKLHKPRFFFHCTACSLALLPESWGFITSGSSGGLEKGSMRRFSKTSSEGGERHVWHRHLGTVLFNATSLATINPKPKMKIMRKPKQWPTTPVQKHKNNTYFFFSNSDFLILINP